MDSFKILVVGFIVCYAPWRVKRKLITVRDIDRRIVLRLIKLSVVISCTMPFKMIILTISFSMIIYKEY